MTFQPQTIVYTRNGRKAEILHVMPSGTATIDGAVMIALVHGWDGPDYLPYYANGRYLPNGECGLDLRLDAVPTVLADHIKRAKETV